MTSRINSQLTTLIENKLIKIIKLKSDRETLELKSPELLNKQRIGEVHKEIQDTRYEIDLISRVQSIISNDNTESTSRNTTH
jgi:hypothetical protein